MVLASLLLSACGAGASPPKSDTSKPAPSRSPQATYLVTKDTTAINKVAAEAQDARTKALTAASMRSCNKIGAYPRWRACWHGLLDPIAKGLTDLVNTFTAMAKRDFPERCRTGFTASGQTFKRFRREVEALLAGYDSSHRGAQVKATKTYVTTLDGIARDFARPFQDLTQVCYSPKDLASINARPTPAP